jgi:hypothetical protein
VAFGNGAGHRLPRGRGDGRKRRRPQPESTASAPRAAAVRRRRDGVRPPAVRPQGRAFGTRSDRHTGAADRHSPHRRAGSLRPPRPLPNAGRGHPQSGRDGPRCGARWADVAGAGSWRTSPHDPARPPSVQPAAVRHLILESIDSPPASARSRRRPRAALPAPARAYGADARAQEQPGRISTLDQRPLRVTVVALVADEPCASPPEGYRERQGPRAPVLPEPLRAVRADPVKTWTRSRPRAHESAAHAAPPGFAG